MWMGRFSGQRKSDVEAGWVWGWGVEIARNISLSRGEYMSPRAPVEQLTELRVDGPSCHPGGRQSPWAQIHITE